MYQSHIPPLKSMGPCAGASIHFSDWGGGQKLEKFQNFRRASRANLEYNILRA